MRFKWLTHEEELNFICMYSGILGDLFHGVLLRIYTPMLAKA